MSRIVELELDFRKETDDAYAVWNGETEKASGHVPPREVWVWLPKSAGVERDGSTFTMPESLAYSKGLI